MVNDLKIMLFAVVAPSFERRYPTNVRQLILPHLRRVCKVYYGGFVPRSFSPAVQRKVKKKE
jgi:hypothetical protein